MDDILQAGGHKLFTPTEQEIGEAELLLTTQLKEINTAAGHPNQQGSPVLEKNLRHYFRQYTGVINETGDKVIRINFVWNRYTPLNKFRDKLRGYGADDHPKFDSRYFNILDGGSYYWQVEANLSRHILQNLEVNGHA